MILIIVGESASGKSTLEKAIRENYGYNKIISYTTRPPREGEKEGVDYHFVSNEEFERLKNENKFIEIGYYNNWNYGSAIEDYVGNIVTVVTPHGMRILTKKLKEPYKVIYLKTPRKDRLIAALHRSDGTFNAIEEIKRRDASDVGQYDGIEDEADIILTNPLFASSPEALAYEVIKKLKE